MGKDCHTNPSVCVHRWRFEVGGDMVKVVVPDKGGEYGKIEEEGEHGWQRGYFM